MKTSCPACESERVYWLLHRVHGRGAHTPQRTITWSCRACGHEWSDPLDPAVAELPLASPPA